MLDPIATSRRVESVYRRYLRSTLQPRDPRFAESFDRQLSRPENRLGRGPILQASAPYVPGSTLRELVSSGVLAADLLSIDQRVLPADRHLYRHQEEAILKVVAGDNAIVATGTGSGKTESFLLPIISSLLHEREDGTLGRPGVRAMLMYPMNALANDQLKRLRQLLAEFPDIRFGRYTGETADDHRSALEEHRQLTGQDPLPNELISREQIAECPPHILVTNYAMLEYLLLRPRDSVLFDGDAGQHWKYLVLDEIHVYDGTKGAEIGHLVRRLRDRVVMSERGRLTCIGTSATLGSGAGSAPEVVEFARALFDEPFTPWSLVHPVRRPLDDLLPTWSITAPQVEALLEVLNSPSTDEMADARRLASAAAAVGCPEVEPAADRAETLGRLLVGESHVAELRTLLASGSRDVQELHGLMQDDVELVGLVELAWRAVDHDGNPVIPARYHMFLGSLEGAFVCLDPQHPDDDPLHLERHDMCPACRRAGRLRRLFEFGACRRCGAGYVVGDRRATDDADRPVLAQAPVVEQRLVHLLLEDASPAEDEDDNIEPEEVVAASKQVLCTTCGVYASDTGGQACCTAPTLVNVTQVEPGTGGVLRRCGACGGQTNSNIVYRFLSGADAASSVVASALYQDLPGGTGGETPDDVLAGGRKLLAFSDSRQDAAFFANFMQRTYDRTLQRRLIWEALRRLRDHQPGGRPQFNDLVARVVNLASEHELFRPGQPVAGRVPMVSAWLLAEVLSIDTSISLEGVGLVHIRPALPEGLVVPDGLLRPGLSPALVTELTVALLSTLRSRNVVSMPDAVTIGDPLFAPRNFSVAVRGEGSDRRVIAWSPGAQRRNARLDLVERVFQRVGVESDARQWLRDVWGWVAGPASQWKWVLPPSNRRTEGVVHQLDPAHLEFLVAGQHVTPRRCDTCRSTSWFELAGACPRNRCVGNTDLTGVDDDNHYRALYSSSELVDARVEEHTAQLSNKEAAKRQAEFVRGAINVLSCSTTFELGVDVGEIQSVLMRNVPPGPANYTQRAGRAGRRKGSPALIMTMAQRRNHDLHYFANPRALIDGVVPAPVIKIANPAIARRHLHAVAFAAFLRHWTSGGGSSPESVLDFYAVDSERGTSVKDEWERWLRTRPEALRLALLRIFSQEVAVEIGVVDWTWVDRLVEQPAGGEGGWLYLAGKKYEETTEKLAAQKAALVAADKLGDANQVNKALRNVEQTRLLADLARNIVLPKYGFPVDTVPMNLEGRADEARSRLELDRDLSMAIVEFAPGSQMVADKNLWHSTGVVIPRGLDLLTYAWRVCKACEALTSDLVHLNPAEVCGVCGAEEASSRGTFVWPQFGFVGEHVAEAGDQRPRRSGYAELHFANYGPTEVPLVEEVRLNGVAVEVLESRHGEIQAINSGSTGPFRLCRRCGRMEEPPARRTRARGGQEWKHKHPGSDRECSGTTFESVALGHRYRTDVLELRLEVESRPGYHFSALHALLAALPDLGVKPEDVGGILRVHDVGRAPAIILLDAVPGGAGHAHYLRENLQQLVDAAWKLVAECTCGVETSCYGCLRSYRNQRHHDRLSRQGALAVLGQFARKSDAP